MKHRAVLNLFSRELLSGLYCQVYVKCASNLLGNVSITLPKEHLKAQFKLVKEVLNEELDVGLYFNTDLIESRNMYEDIDFFVLVLSDRTVFIICWRASLLIYSNH